MVINISTLNNNLFKKPVSDVWAVRWSVHIATQILSPYPDSRRRAGNTYLVVYIFCILVWLLTGSTLLYRGPLVLLNFFAFSEESCQGANGVSTETRLNSGEIRYHSKDDIFRKPNLRGKISLFALLQIPSQSGRLGNQKTNLIRQGGLILRQEGHLGLGDALVNLLPWK